jgi:hypothetical protein
MRVPHPFHVLCGKGGINLGCPAPIFCGAQAPSPANSSPDWNQVQFRRFWQFWRVPHPFHVLCGKGGINLGCPAPIFMWSAGALACEFVNGLEPGSFSAIFGNFGISGNIFRPITIVPLLPEPIRANLPPWPRNSSAAFATSLSAVAVATNIAASARASSKSACARTASITAVPAVKPVTCTPSTRPKTRIGNWVICN